MKKEYKLLKDFKKRYEKVGVFQERQLHKLSMRKKFYQLASVISLGFGLKLNFKEDPDKLKVRSRWIFLKRGFNEGRISV